jgi:hypothetical protein
MLSPLIFGHTEAQKHKLERLEAEYNASAHRGCGCPCKETDVPWLWLYVDRPDLRSFVADKFEVIQDDDHWVVFNTEDGVEVSRTEDSYAAEFDCHVLNTYHDALAAARERVAKAVTL